MDMYKPHKSECISLKSAINLIDIFIHLIIIILPTRQYIASKLYLPFLLILRLYDEMHPSKIPKKRNHVYAKLENKINIIKRRQGAASWLFPR
jgi:hypothetical protein